MTGRTPFSRENRAIPSQAAGRRSVPTALKRSLRPAKRKAISSFSATAKIRRIKNGKRRTSSTRSPREKMLARFRHRRSRLTRPLTELKEHWEKLLSTFRLSSGDEKLNRMVNIWNQYQCMVTFNMSRSASYFESGIGRGMGFRDSTQDLLGFVHLIPARARERILDIAATQMEDGSAYHQYQPLTKRGNLDVGSGFNDDPLWLIFGVNAYLKETGDWSILNEKVPFDNGEGKGRAAARAPETLVRPCGKQSRAARTAAHRPRRLERLPEPQLLLQNAGRVVPDLPEYGKRRCGVRVHRGHVRVHRPGLRRDLPQDRQRRRSGTCRSKSCGNDAGRAEIRLGRRLVPARV